MTRGTPGNLQYGPGKLYIAPLGTTEPTDLTTAWDAAWILLGYTKDGHTFNYQISTSPVNVAEELDPIKNVTTGRVGTLSFSAAEVLAKNLIAAFNGGTITGTSTAPRVISLPALGAETRRMIGWESETADERWVYRQCMQTGSIGINRQPGANNTLLPMTFSLEKPNGLDPFTPILAAARA